MISKTVVSMLVLAACAARAAAAPFGFVGVDATGRGFALYGQPFRYVGTNCYYLFDYGTGSTYDDAGNPVANSRQYVREVLDEASAMGVKVVRTWAFAAGNLSQPLGGKYNLFELGSPGNFQENTLRGLDYVVAEASARGIRVLPALVNNWDDYGGMRWYVQHSATADQTNAGVTDNTDPKWSQYHDQFYSDPDCRQFYKNYLSCLLNRTNTFTGRAYKDDPAIFAWELANEPRAKSNAPNTALLDNWVAEMSAYIKSLDPGHMVTTGIEGWGTPWDGTNFVSTQANANIDFATLHFYPDSWDWFPKRSLDTDGSHLPGGIDQNKIDWWTSKSGITYLDPAWGQFYDPDEGLGNFDNWPMQNADWANDRLAKPVILEEIGLLKSHPDALKDRFYQQAIDSFFGAGGDGINLWAHAHDAYAAMDDGFLYFVSGDPALSGPSRSALDAIAYAVGNWADTPAQDPALAIPEPARLVSAALIAALLLRRRCRRM